MRKLLFYIYLNVQKKQNEVRRNINKKIKLFISSILILFTIGCAEKEKKELTEKDLKEIENKIYHVNGWTYDSLGIFSAMLAFHYENYTQEKLEQNREIFLKRFSCASIIASKYNNNNAHKNLNEITEETVNCIKTGNLLPLYNKLYN